MLEIESLKRPIINSEIEFVIKKKKRKTTFQQKKSPGLEDFHGSLVVKNPCFNAGNRGSISGQGTRISRAVEQLSLKSQYRASYTRAHAVQLEKVHALK